MRISLNINNLPFYALLLLLGLTVTGCLEDSCEETRNFIEFEAIFVHPDDFRIPVEFIASRELENPGKIYYYEDHIMINELYEGIHIYDNTDPRNPSYKGFLSIPGNVDVAIRDDLMYADSYVDLLTIDYSNLTRPTILCRDEEVFDNYNWLGDQGYYIGTRGIGRSVEMDCSEPNRGSEFFFRNGGVFIDQDAWSNAGGGFPTTGGPEGGGGTTTANNITGAGGSFARFSVIDDRLYVINNSELIAYDLGMPAKPIAISSTYVNWNIETIIPYKNYLFIGGNAGMYIYDRTNPDEPVEVSRFEHANACDPVFVKDDIAYVTLRSGTLCQGFTNQLDVIDVSDIESPRLIKSFEMDNPHGLSIRDNNLYLCEGIHGLKVFEIDDLESISDNRIEHVRDVHAYDAISLNADHLLIIGEGGLFQYDSSNPSDLKQMSFVSSTGN